MIKYSHGPQYDSRLYVITKVFTADSVDDICYETVMVPQGEEEAYSISDLDDNQSVCLVARAQ
jgi:hypothetical protein